MTPLIAAVAAFNLICNGTTFVGDMKKENQSAYSQTFRIDLEVGRWCSGACETTDTIARISDTQIVLKLEREDEPHFESFILLNREDGSILDRTKFDYQLLIMSSGKCKRGPFTGFPARKF